MFRLKSWVLKLFAREAEEKTAAEQLARRINYAVESILTNESLSDELDDASAELLLDWGATRAKIIVQSAVELNAVETEDLNGPRLRATRRLMRLVNRWTPKRTQMDIEGNLASLSRVIEQASIIYGKDFSPPDDKWQETFLKHNLSAPSSQFIANLRMLIENPNENLAGDPGGAND